MAVNLATWILSFLPHPLSPCNPHLVSLLEYQSHSVVTITCLSYSRRFLWQGLRLVLVTIISSGLSTVLARGRSLINVCMLSGWGRNQYKTRHGELVGHSLCWAASLPEPNHPKPDFPFWRWESQLSPTVHTARGIHILTDQEVFDGMPTTEFTDDCAQGRAICIPCRKTMPTFLLRQRRGSVTMQPAKQIRRSCLAQPWEEAVGWVMLLQQRRAVGMERPGGGQLCPGTSKSVWGWWHQVTF